MGDRITFQAAQTEFSAQIFLRRECQCHQNSDVDHIDRQFIAHGVAKAYQMQLEFLKFGHDGAYHAHVLH